MATGKTAPEYWFRPFSWQSLALSPIALAYGAIAGRGMARAKPASVDAPVLCVGNFTVGGTGKTPATLALAQIAKERGFRPGVVLRGYGGSKRRAHRVDPAIDSTREVGDEALMYAARFPTMVGTDRRDSAARLCEEGCNFIFMDDGFQSRRLYYDFALSVVDARRGFGNGRSLPAGPLRAPLNVQLPYADMLLLVGEGEKGEEAIRHAARAAKPVVRAKFLPVQAKTMLRKKHIAFSGIGDPEKFFDTIRRHGGNLIHTQPFPDHHEYSELDASGLLDAATRKKLALITTEKDHVRLKGKGGLREQLADKASVLRVELVFSDPARSAQIIDNSVENFQARRVRELS
ncbi:MAG: tetraacyldisaccharide 4'-kinase [Pseudomonadota bacterium]